MSYALAYTTHFRSLDNTLWEMEIYIDGHVGNSLEIKLEGDEPCVIEWQECGKTDVVQSATCTLRVSNESDRQMVQLMSNSNAFLKVFRNKNEYWRGMLDESIYEEPYSFTKGYPTEIHFSDFGILNRIDFDLHGKQSVSAILNHCLDGSGLDYLYQELLISLLEPKTLQPITLSMLYLNADRFASRDDVTWSEKPSKRDVLEEVLRPLGLRIMQKNGQLHIYDIEYLRDNSIYDYIVWKGTDAYLKGSETYGMYEVAFEPDANETLAEDGLDYNSPQWLDGETYRANSYNDATHDATDIGFFIEFKDYLNANIQKSPAAKYYRTRGVFSGEDVVGVAWRVKCLHHLYNMHIGSHTVPVVAEETPVDNLLSASRLVRWVTEVFHIESLYMPLVPDRNKFQLRINLDFLLSLRPNPFDNPPKEWVEQQDWYHRLERFWDPGEGVDNYVIDMYYIPVKLELIDENGNVLYHYKNVLFESAPASIPLNERNYFQYLPYQQVKPGWVAGAGSFEDMCLAYYKTKEGGFYDWDASNDPVITSGFVTNRQCNCSSDMARIRTEGEYVPLPPVAGKLRLTVGSGVFTMMPFPRLYELIYYNSEEVRWHLFRNPRITLVKANRKDDKINADTFYEREAPNRIDDRLSDSVKAGTWNKGIAPSARGLFFRSYGDVWEGFVKNGELQTLEKHRVRCFEDQFMLQQPTLSGTAELDVQFCAKRENSTQGDFLVTYLRQDLHEDTEEVTMVRIAPVGAYVYEFAWGDPVCVQEFDPQYKFEWDEPVCAQVQEPSYRFEWNGKFVCVEVPSYDFAWGPKLVCVQVDIKQPKDEEEIA